MDFKRKYLKYKSKYLKYKKEQTGGDLNKSKLLLKNAIKTNNILKKMSNPNWSEETHKKLIKNSDKIINLRINELEILLKEEIGDNYSFKLIEDVVKNIQLEAEKELKAGIKEKSSL